MDVHIKLATFLGEWRDSIGMYVLVEPVKPGGKGDLDVWLSQPAGARQPIRLSLMSVGPDRFKCGHFDMDLAKSSQHSIVWADRRNTSKVTIWERQSPAQTDYEMKPQDNAATSGGLRSSVPGSSSRDPEGDQQSTSLPAPSKKSSSLICVGGTAELEQNDVSNEVGCGDAVETSDDAELGRALVQAAGRAGMFDTASIPEAPATEGDIGSGLVAKDASPQPTVGSFGATPDCPMLTPDEMLPPSHEALDPPQCTDGGAGGDTCDVSNESAVSRLPLEDPENTGCPASPEGSATSPDDSPTEHPENALGSTSEPPALLEEEIEPTFGVVEAQFDADEVEVIDDSDSDGNPQDAAADEGAPTKFVAAQIYGNGIAPGDPLRDPPLEEQAATLTELLAASAIPSEQSASAGLESMLDTLASFSEKAPVEESMLDTLASFSERASTEESEAAATPAGGADLDIGGLLIALSEALPEIPASQAPAAVSAPAVNSSDKQWWRQMPASAVPALPPAPPVPVVPAALSVPTVASVYRWGESSDDAPTALVVPAVPVALAVAAVPPPPPPPPPRTDEHLEQAEFGEQEAPWAQEARRERENWELEEERWQLEQEQWEPKDMRGQEELWEHFQEHVPPSDLDPVVPLPLPVPRAPPPPPAPPTPLTAEDLERQRRLAAYNAVLLGERAPPKPPEPPPETTPEPPERAAADASEEAPWARRKRRKTTSGVVVVGAG